MATTATINAHELLQVAEAVSREKAVDREIVLSALESAIARAARTRYGMDYDIRVHIDRKGGSINVYRFTEVVAEIDNEFTQMTLSAANEVDPKLQIGDFYQELLPPVEVGRISAQSARQIIIQKIREAERHRQFEEFKDKIGDIVYGIVRRVEFGNVIVDLSGRAEAILRRNEVIPRENFKVGDRLRAYIYDVKSENNGSQILLSRTHPQFLAKLFSMEVPEIYDGVIEIKAVARDPGSRAKIAVHTEDSSIDAIGACVGLRGARVQAVINELQGEKIDIIDWSDNAATLLVNALAPVEVIRVVVDEEDEKIAVVVPDENLSQVIGRRGQNIRLISQIVGWNVDVLTETTDAERRQKDFSERTKLFMIALNIDEIFAQLLATEGFVDVEDLAYCEVHELVVEGIDEDTAAELKERALTYLERKTQLEMKQKGFDFGLLEIDGITTDRAKELFVSKILTLDDFAGLTAEELFDEEAPIWSHDHISLEQAGEMIMAARKKLGWL